MNCIKTGAYFLVQPHNFHVVGDLYTVGNCAVLRINQESMSYTPDRTITHVVDVSVESWDRGPDLGVVVVPFSHVRKVEHAAGAA